MKRSFNFEKWRSAFAHMDARALSFLFTRPKLILMLAAFFALLTMAHYNQNLRSSIGEVRLVSAGQQALLAEKSPLAPRMMQLGQPRTLLSPDQLKASRKTVAEINFWQAETEPPLRLRIAVTGCVESASINDVEIQAPGLRGCGLKRVRVLDNLTPYIHSGVNTLQLNMTSTPAGLIDIEVFPSYSHWSVFVGLYLAIAFTVIAVMRLLHFNGGIIGMTLVSVLLCFAFFYSTGYGVRGPDVSDHLSYITYLLTFHSIPPPHIGYQMYQPPLFYLLSAGAYSVWGVLTNGDPMYAVRLLTLILYITFIIICLCIIRRWMSGVKYTAIASAVLLFWPMGIAHSTFINNDVLVWVMFAGSLYWLTRWYVSRSHRHLAWCIAFCGLAFLSKNTAVALPIIIGAVMFFALRPWRAFKTRGYAKRTLKPLVSLPVLLSLIFTFACVGSNFGRTYYYKNTKAHSLQYIIGNAGINRINFEKKDSLINYFRFNYLNFVEWPRGQRIASKEPLDFWTVFLRTWMVGADSTGRIGPKSITQTMGLLFPILLLYIIAIAAWRYVEGTPLEKRRLLPWALLFALMVASLMAARMIYQTNTAGHARYMYIITMVVAVLYAQNLQWLERRGRRGLATGGLGIMLVFTALGVTLLLGRVTQIFIR